MFTMLPVSKADAFSRHLFSFKLFSLFIFTFFPFSPLFSSLFTPPFTLVLTLFSRAFPIRRFFQLRCIFPGRITPKK